MLYIDLNFVILQINFDPYEKSVSITWYYNSCIYPFM